MTVFPFPPDADAPFSVVGFDWADGEPAGELFVLPRGMRSPVAGAPVWSPEGGAAGTGALCDAETAGAEQPVWMDCFCPHGTIRDRLTHAAQQYGARLWLHLTPIAQLYALPCPDGRGRTASRAEQERALAEHPSCFCPEFLCQCCHWAKGGQIFVLLYDTGETIGMKLALADTLGVKYVFGELESR